MTALVRPFGLIANNPAHLGGAIDAAAGDKDARGQKMGQAMNMAGHLEIDAVIDLAETRTWLLRGLTAAGGAPRRDDGRRRVIATW